MPLDEIRQELGIETRQLKAGLEALEEAGYIEVGWAMGWSEDRAGGWIDMVTERTRRELGSWPTATSIVEEIVRALLEQAQQTPEPEQKGRLRVTFPDANHAFFNDTGARYARRRHSRTRARARLVRALRRQRLSRPRECRRPAALPRAYCRAADVRPATTL